MLPLAGTLSPVHCTSLPVTTVPPLLMVFGVPKLLGTVSLTLTPVAALGPALLTVMVKVTTPLRSGELLLTILVSDRSALVGALTVVLWVALVVLLAVFTSAG